MELHLKFPFRIYIGIGGLCTILRCMFFFCWYSFFLLLGGYVVRPLQHNLSLIYFKTSYFHFKNSFFLILLSLSPLGVLFIFGIRGNLNFFCYLCGYNWQSYSFFLLKERKYSYLQSQFLMECCTVIEVLSLHKILKQFNELMNCANTDVLW